MTDHLEIFPQPEPSNDLYHLVFPLRGLRYLPDSSQRRAWTLESGERLRLFWDVQNDVDAEAVGLRTEDKHIVGYVPRYLSSAILAALRNSAGEPPEVSVKGVTKDAPIQYRCFCLLRVNSRIFSPYDSELFKPLEDKDGYEASEAVNS
ncbi:MAG: HIRAN domain-containing protein [Vulcanimicrobiota bacterium]